MLQGAYTYLLQDENGQVSLTHSVSAGLDYALIGPEHAWLHDQGRARVHVGFGPEALAAAETAGANRKVSFRRWNRRMPWPMAIEQAPAAKGQIFLVNLSGRGDKDVDIYRENFPAFGRIRCATRIADRFTRLQEEGRPGDWSLTSRPEIRRRQHSAALALALERGGADIIELGVPFSDPIADGPVIQRASDRALHAGMTLAGVLDVARQIRRSERDSADPVQLHEPAGSLRFRSFGAGRGTSRHRRRPDDRLSASRRRRSPWPSCARNGLDTVFLAAPTSTERRMRLVAEYSSGFVYVVSRTGVTGEKDSVRRSRGPSGGDVALPHQACRSRSDSASPSPSTVSAVGGYADAVVVGSAFVRVIEEHGGIQRWQRAGSFHTRTLR